MAIGPFLVGEQPADPIVLTVVDADGNPVDFTNYDTVAVMGTMPVGTSTPLANGVLQYKLSEPFATVGTFEIRVAMFQNDGDTDYSQPFEYTVTPLVDYTGIRVTPEQVYANTGSTVTSQDVVVAQSDINLFVARNLGDDDVWSVLSATDQHWLGVAISHQAVHRANPSGMDIPIGANNVRAGDVSVSSPTAFTAEDVLMTPLAVMALRHVSWVNHGTMHATPFLGDARTPVRPLWEAYR